MKFRFVILPDGRYLIHPVDGSLTAEETQHIVEGFGEARVITCFPEPLEVLDLRQVAA